ncbi:MAG TPA: tetratricopeptide repeat protein [Myxococcales bacterium]
MASQRGSKTPAKVQVYFFEKKARTPTVAKVGTADDNPVTEPSELPTSTDNPIPELPAAAVPSPAAGRSRRNTGERPSAGGPANGRAAVRRNIRNELADPSRHPTIKIKAMAGEPSPGFDRRVVPRTPTPAAIPAGSAREALEYHRLKLQQMAARHHDEASHSLTNMALFGHTLYARGQLRQAQVVFENLVAREPDEAFAYTMLGAIFLAQEDDSRALALFDAALGLQADEMAALVGRAEIRLRRGQPQAALADLEAAIDADPSGRDPFSERARALLVLARTLSRTLR